MVQLLEVCYENINNSRFTVGFSGRYNDLIADSKVSNLISPHSEEVAVSINEIFKMQEFNQSIIYDSDTDNVINKMLKFINIYKESSMSFFVSIICTVKNGEKTIKDTIESVLNQSYKKWEFIIIDDGSTDDTCKILIDYSLKDERIKVYSTGGIGRSKALNKAIDISVGEYIANIDADDLWHPQKTELQLKYISGNKDYFLLSTDSFLIYNDEKPIWKKKELTLDFTNITHSILIRNKISHVGVMMKRSDLIELGAYNERLKTQVDYELWLRAFTNKYKMGIIPIELSAKRIHENQSYENKKRIKYVFNSMILQLKYIAKNRKFIFLLPIPLVVFLLSLLPFEIRRKIVNIANK